MKSIADVAAKMGNKLSDISSHSALLSIRNAYLSILPYVIVMAGFVFFKELLRLLDVGGRIATDVSMLVELLRGMFPEVVLLGLAWHFNKTDRLRGITLSFVSLIFFWILSGAGPLEVKQQGAGENLDVFAIYPALILTHYIFRFFETRAYFSKSTYPVLSQMVSRNINYIIPALVTVIVAGFLRALWISLEQADFSLGEGLSFLPYGVELILFTFVVQLCWFFSIHGMSVLLGVFGYFSLKSEAQGLLSPDFFHLYTSPGGAGGVLCLVIVMLVTKSSPECKMLAKVSLPLVIFNISETIVFGVPLVFNFRMMAAFLLVPTLNMVISYSALTAGLLEPQLHSVHWAVPLFFNSFMAYGEIYWPSLLLQFVCLSSGIIIYFFAWRRFIRFEVGRLQIEKALLDNQDNSIALDDDAFDIVVGSENTARWQRIANVDATLNLVRASSLFLVFQPVMSTSADGSPRCMYVESLLRLRDPAGNVHPPVFLDLLRDHPRVMESIESWVIRETFSVASQWQEKGIRARLYMNCTPLFFSSSKMRAYFNEARQNNPNAVVGVEITEQSLLDNLEDSQEAITALQYAGISFSLDDFGSGYSSFNYLTHLTVDFVKIDKSLIDLVDDHRHRTVIDAINQLCESLDMQVIAEGVETKEQREFLQDLGIDNLQGFHFHRPMEQVEIEHLLTELSLDKTTRNL